MQRGARELGEDAAEADKLSEATKDVARARYQRLFWEPVVEGKVSGWPRVNRIIILILASGSDRVCLASEGNSRWCYINEGERSYCSLEASWSQDGD